MEIKLTKPILKIMGEMWAVKESHDKNSKKLTSMLEIYYESYEELNKCHAIVANSMRFVRSSENYERAKEESIALLVHEGLTTDYFGINKKDRFERIYSSSKINIIDYIFRLVQSNSRGDDLVGLANNFVIFKKKDQPKATFDFIDFSVSDTNLGNAFLPILHTYNFDGVVQEAEFTSYQRMLYLFTDVLNQGNIDNNFVNNFLSISPYVKKPTSVPDYLNENIDRDYDVKLGIDFENLVICLIGDGFQKYQEFQERLISEKKSIKKKFLSNPHQPNCYQNLGHAEGDYIPTDFKGTPFEDKCYQDFIEVLRD